MTLEIDARIPGGNIIVQSIDGHRAVLHKDMRDTAGEWFYWKFHACFVEPGDYTFLLGPGPSIGPRGPAVSSDQGLTWHYAGKDTANYAEESFTWHCDTVPQERWFCVCIPYLQGDWERFWSRYPNSPVCKGYLCRSRQGRNVELLSIGNGNASRRVLLTCRHHAGESMANYVIEGILMEIMDFPESFRDFFFQIVPFVDKDGVENGDQGKNRIPHDHNRDYGPQSIYPETKALMALCQKQQFHLTLDLHCPWLRGPNNEAIYFVGKEHPRIQEGIDRFSRLLSEEAPPHVPYDPNDNVPFGTSWNTSANYRQGKDFSRWSGECPWSPWCISTEIPFANTHEHPLDGNAARDLGRAFARTIRRMLAPASGK